MFKTKQFNSLIILKFPLNISVMRSLEVQEKTLKELIVKLELYIKKMTFLYVN